MDKKKSVAQVDLKNGRIRKNDIYRHKHNCKSNKKVGIPLFVIITLIIGLSWIIIGFYLIIKELF